MRATHALAVRRPPQRSLSRVGLRWLAALAIGLLWSWSAQAQVGLASHVPGNPLAAGNGGLGGAPGDRNFATARDVAQAAYSATASNLAPGQTGTGLNVFWKALGDSTGSLLVSHVDGNNNAACSAAGAVPGTSVVIHGGISADGRFVVYVSDCVDLAAGSPSDPAGSVWVWDRNSNSNSLISFNASLLTASAGAAAIISADGTTIFYYGATSDVPGAAGGAPIQGIRANRAVPATKSLVTHISASPTTGSAGDAYSGVGAISNQGRFILYADDGTDLVPGSAFFYNGTPNLYLYDAVADSSSLVNNRDGDPSEPGAPGVPGGNHFELTSTAVMVNNNVNNDSSGMFIAYASTSSQLVTPFADHNGAAEPDVFLYTSNAGGDNYIASFNAGGSADGGGDGASRNPSIQGDGSNAVAFESTSTDLVPGQLASSGINIYSNSNPSDIIVMRLHSHIPGNPTTTANGDSRFPVYGPQGIAYVSTASNLITGLADSNGNADAFVNTVSTNNNRALSYIDGTAPATGSGGIENVLFGNSGLVAYFPSTTTAQFAAQVDGNGGADLFFAQYPAVTPTIELRASADPLAAVPPALNTGDLVTPEIGDPGFDPNSDSPADPTAPVLFVLQPDLPFTTFLPITVPIQISGTADLAPADFSVRVFRYDTISSTYIEGPSLPIAGGNLTFLPEDISVLLAITGIDDSVYESATNETVVVTLGTLTNANADPSLDTQTAQIADDEAPPVIDFGAAVSNATEGAGGSIALQLSNASDAPISLAYTIGGSAASPADFTISSANPLVIPAGATAATINFTSVDDAIFEGNETVTLTLVAPSGATLGAVTVHTLTITDNDSQPTVRFAAATSSIGEGAGGGSISVQLSGASASNISVPYSLGGTAATPGDYSIATPNPLVILAGSTSATLNFSVVGDALVEADETSIVTLGVPTGATLAAPTVHTLTIVDDDAAPPTPSVRFSTASSNVTEGGVRNVTVTLSAVGASDVFVPFSIGGSATDPDDYSVGASSPLVILAGSLSATIPITSAADSLDEANETVILTLGAPVGATLGVPQVHVLTINDNTSTPSVSFAAAASSVAEGAAVATINLSLSAVSNLDVTLPFTLGGAATSDDYSLLTPSPLVIPAGATTASIRVQADTDTLDEANEALVITLGTPQNAVLGTLPVHTLTITDTNTQPTLRFQTTTSSAGEGVQALVALQLSAPSGQDVSVPFTVGGSAGDPADYSLATATPIVIPAGTTTAFIAIDTVADSVVDAGETVRLTLGTPVNANLGNQSVHTLTIREGNALPVVRFATSASSIDEGGSVSIRVVLSEPTSVPVSIAYSLSGTATADDYTLTPDPLASQLVIPAGSTVGLIRLASVDDNHAEGDETAILTLLTPTDASLGAPAVHTVTLADNDPLPLATFDVASLRVREGESARLTVRLATPTDRDFIVPFSTSGSGQAGADFALSSSPLVIPAGSTEASLDLTVFDDRITEGNETLAITLDQGTLAKSSNPIQIVLVDSAAQVGFTASQTTVSEGFETELTVELEAPLDEDAVVDFVVTSLFGEPGATAGDYVISASPLVIPAGQTTGRIVLRAVTDDQIEVEECMLVRLQVSVNSVPGPRSETLVLIRNVGGNRDQGGGALGLDWLGLLLAVGLLRQRRVRIAIGSLCLCALSISPAIAAPDFIYPSGRNWLLADDDLVIRPGPIPAGELLYLELDAIDVSALATINPEGLIVLHPAVPLLPGPHRFRLVQQNAAGELLEIGNWALELRRSNLLRSANAAYAVALQGNTLALGSDDIDLERDYSGNVNAALAGQADTGLLMLQGRANLSANSNSQQLGQDDLQLGDFQVAAGDADTQVIAGHFSMAPIGAQQVQPNFAYDGGNRRGISLSTRLPFMSGTATAYSMGAEPVLGFRNGLMFSSTGRRYTGGMVQALPYSTPGSQVGLTLGYLEGQGRYGGTAIYSAADNLIVQTPGIDGSTGNAILDTRWLAGALSFRAEYARSERKFPLVFGIQLEPVTDDAQSYVLSYQTPQGIQIGDNTLTGYVTLDHQVIGTAFRSVGAPGGAIDVDQDRISTGLQYSTLSLDLAAARSQDNIADAPFPTTQADNHALQLSWSPAFDTSAWPSFLQQPSASLGWGSDLRETRRLPPGANPYQRTDTANRNLTSTLSFVQPLGGWSLSYGRSARDDDTGQSQDFRGDTGSIDASFQIGETLSLTTQLFTDLSRQLRLSSAPDAPVPYLVPGLVTRTQSGSLGLQWLIIPQRWDLALSYAASHASTGDDSLDSRAQQVDFNTNLAVWKLVLFLRGSYQYARDRSLVPPYEDEFGVIPPPEYQSTRRDSYQVFAGFSYNFSEE